MEDFIETKIVIFLGKLIRNQYPTKAVFSGFLNNEDNQ